MAKDYGSWTLAALKTELRKRHAKTTGKKAILIQRLEYYDSIFGGLVNEPESTYKINIPKLEDFMDITSDTDLPMIRQSDLVRYSTLADRENLITSQNMYNEKYLLSARSSKHDADYYVMGVCQSEMRKAVTYTVTLKVQENIILEGQCECSAGIGPFAQCKHIMVLIYGLIDYNKSKSIKTFTSCTSTLQTFHRPTTIYSGEPVKAEDLQLKINNILTKYDPRPSDLKPESNEKYVDHFNSVSMSLSGQQGKETLPVTQFLKPADKKALFQDHDYLDKTHEEKYLDSLKMTHAELAELERKTRTDKAMWLRERTTRIQSSVYGKVCKAVDKNKDKLAASLLQIQKPINSPAIKHGILYEEKAIQTFQEKTGFKVTKCGLFLNKLIQYLGCTPDGLVGDDAVLEVKCPYSAKDENIGSGTIKYVILCEKTGQFLLDKSHDYYYQVQGQLLCTGRMKAYFCIYTFVDFCIIEIKRDKQFIANLISDLNAFYNNHFKRALLNKKLYLNK